MNKSHRLKKHSLFTLIELLLVVAIISILAALLFPGVNKARMSARRLACLNNTKQIGIGMSIYLSEWKGAFPPGMYSQTDPSWPMGTYTYWYNLLRLEMNLPQNPDLFYCNSARINRQTYNYPRAYNYGYSSDVLYNKRITDLQKASGTIMVLDWPSSSANIAYGVNFENPVLAPLFQHYVPGAGSWDLRVLAAAQTRSGALSIADYNNGALWDDFMQGRHGLHVNVLYTDGHSASLSSKNLVQEFYYKPATGSSASSAFSLSPK